MIAVEPGKKVAVLSLRPGSRDDQVTFATIKTVGKRDIVLDDGQRFNASRQERSIGGAYGTLARLHDVDDPQVVDSLRKQRIRNVARKIVTLAEEIPGGCPDQARAAAELAGFAVRLQELVGLPQAAEEAAP